MYLRIGEKNIFESILLDLKYICTPFSSFRVEE